MIPIVRADGAAEWELLASLRRRGAEVDRKVTAAVTEIVDGRRVEYVGLEAFVFLCKAHLDGREKLYELRYTVATHRWTLAKEVY